MADDPNLPHPYVRRRDPRLGEWCVDCGRGAWHPVHGRRQPDPGLLIEETDEDEPVRERYMMATTAIHKLGDISRDEPHLAIIDREDGDDYVGQWAAGIGFVEVHFPKATTRPLNAEERQRYRSMLIEEAGRVWPIVLGEDETPEGSDRG